MEGSSETEGKELILDVISVQLRTLESFPPQLGISARGNVPNPRWSNGELIERIYVIPPVDGFYEYEFRAKPPEPGDIGTENIVEIEAFTTRGSIPNDLKGIRVIAKNNSVEEPYSQGEDVPESKAYSQ